ncbi:hypothetical protein NE237_029630 [Protea cynaroides]|uniref:Uncharacterized protein n=1 Tax=Protea cynaroides TaxID=273540 RepID=A0A9Q0GS57_9MAGN|nr:hypothetical protein NE237_029630 [Protea cynaroides]
MKRVYSTPIKKRSDETKAHGIRWYITTFINLLISFPFSLIFYGCEPFANIITASSTSLLACHEVELQRWVVVAIAGRPSSSLTRSPPDPSSSSGFNKGWDPGLRGRESKRPRGKVKDLIWTPMMRYGLQAALCKGARTAPLKRISASSVNHDDIFYHSIRSWCFVFLIELVILTGIWR